MREEAADGPSTGSPESLFLSRHDGDFPIAGPVESGESPKPDEFIFPHRSGGSHGATN